MRRKSSRANFLIYVKCFCFCVKVIIFSLICFVVLNI